MKNTVSYKWKLTIFVISNDKSLISQILKVEGPSGGKFNFFSAPEFKAILIAEPQKLSTTKSEGIIFIFGMAYLDCLKTRSDLDSSSPTLHEVR